MYRVLHRRLLGMALAVLSLSIAACSKSVPGATDNPEEDQKYYELQEVGWLYEAGQVDRQKPPTKLKDLEPYQMGYPVGYQALRAGQCVVIWGVDMLNDPTPQQTVLAYRQEAATAGGMVLLVDKSIKTMTPEQLKAALPAR